jgi:hypothetical protein
MSEVSSDAVARKVFSMTLVGCLVFILASVLFVLAH